MKWEQVSLKSVAKIDRKSIPAESILSGTKYIGLEHIQSGGKILPVEKIESGHLKSSKFSFNEKHILYGKLRPYLAKIATPDFSGICSTDIIPILPNELIDRSYLAYFLKQDKMIEYASSLASGANLPRLSPSDLAEFKIPLPPLPEQKRIAAILDAADALRTQRRQSIAELDLLLQSTFLEMFGDPTAQNWDFKTVGDFVLNTDGAIRTGPFGSQLLHSEFVDKGIKVLGIDNVVANEFRDGEPRFITLKKYEKLKRYTVHPDDVLITIMGTCGRCAVVPKNIETSINTKHLCCITLDQKKCLPSFMQKYFLLHPLAHRYLASNSKGAIMSGLNMAIIKKLPIPAPPIELQQKFAEIAEAIEAQKERLQAHLAELDTLFASLQQRAFNGEP